MKIKYTIYLLLITALSCVNFSCDNFNNLDQSKDLGTEAGNVNFSYDNFNGLDQFKDLGSEVGNSVRTIAFCFRPARTYNEQDYDFTALIWRDDNQENSEFGVYLGGSRVKGFEGKLIFQRDVQGEKYRVFSNDSNWKANVWHQVVATIESEGGMKLYIDGVLQSDSDLSNAPTDQRTEITAIARWGDEDIRYFKGEIGNVTLSKNEMKREEVKKLFEKTKRKLK